MRRWWRMSGVAYKPRCLTREYPIFKHSRFFSLFSDVLTTATNVWMITTT
jgi:hypothetical protein